MAKCKDCEKEIKDGFFRCFDCNKKFKEKSEAEGKTDKPTTTTSMQIKTMKGYDFEELDERYNKFGLEFNIAATQTDHLLVGDTEQGAKVLRIITIYY